MPDKRNQKKLIAESDRLYRKYAKPLEKEHWGKFIVIFPDGKTVLGESDLEVMQRAMEEYGPGGFVFKIGPMAVYRL